ncbi:hypothetical protein HKW80_32895, partial [Pseudomonas aeruginosa]|nr:hypothetical protein [Pseudomonas aeruginosa]
MDYQAPLRDMRFVL